MANVISKLCVHAADNEIIERNSHRLKYFRMLLNETANGSISTAKELLGSTMPIFVLPTDSCSGTV